MEPKNFLESHFNCQSDEFVDELIEFGVKFDDEFDEFDELIDELVALFASFRVNDNVRVLGVPSFVLSFVTLNPACNLASSFVVNAAGSLEGCARESVIFRSGAVARRLVGCLIDCLD